MTDINRERSVRYIEIGETEGEKQRHNEKEGARGRQKGRQRDIDRLRVGESQGERERR